jgi:hypothetical protein
VRRRSRHRSRAGWVGGMSAARISSSPLVVLKVPATARPITVDSLLKPSRSHFWSSQIASIPCAAMDIATDQATFLAIFLGDPLAFMTREIVLMRWCPSASRCLTWACQLSRQSIKKPSHLVGLTKMLNLRLIPCQRNSHSSVFFIDGPRGLSPAKIHATSVLSLSIPKPYRQKTSCTLFKSCEGSF